MSLNIEFNNEDNDKINDLYEKIKINDEFEVSINAKEGMNYEKYNNIVKHMKLRNKLKNLEIIQTNTLDISYSKEEINYRITITNDENDNINKYNELVYQYPNHLIYNALITYFQKGEKNIEVMKKTKNIENMIDIDSEIDLILAQKIGENYDF